MFKFRQSNPTNAYELEVDNFVTRMNGVGEEIAHSIIRTEVEYASRTIHFEVFDLQGGLTETFFEQLSQHPELRVRLKVYRVGAVLDYVKRFEGAKIVSRSVDYDYTLQESTRHVVKMTFESHEIEKICPLEGD